MAVDQTGAGAGAGAGGGGFDLMDTSEYLKFLDKYDGDDGRNVMFDIVKNHQGDHFNVGADFRVAVDKIMDNVAAKYAADPNGEGGKALEELATVITEMHHVQKDEAAHQGLHSVDPNSIMFGVGHAFQGVLFKEGTTYQPIDGLDIQVDPYNGVVTQGKELYDKVLAFLKNHAKTGKLSDVLGTGYKNAGGGPGQADGAVGGFQKWIALNGTTDATQLGGENVTPSGSHADTRHQM